VVSEPANYVFGLTTGTLEKSRGRASGTQNKQIHLHS